MRLLYIAVMDADDSCGPKRLEKQAAFLEKHKEYAFVGCNVWMADGRGIWGRRVLEETPEKESFLSTLPFVHPSIMLRREAVLESGGYAEEAWARRAEDYDLLMRMYARGYRGYNLQETLYCYREDRDSYKKRKYRCRFDECRVRYAGFYRMGILRGHLRYVARPLIAGLIPACMMRKIKERRYRVNQGGFRAVQKADSCSIGRPKRDMDDIRIFVTHTVGSANICVQNPLFYHVAAGSDSQAGPLPEGMLADNTGEHISYKNPSYCELTTQYWAWKNVEADYYGFCHYRRYFSFAPRLLREAGWGCVSIPYLDQKAERKLCLDVRSIRRKVERYDCLTAKGIPVQALYADSVYGHYKNAPELHVEDLKLFREIVCRKFPKLRDAADRYLKGKTFYPCNMFIMKKELFMEYAQMLFAVLEEFERRADMRSYSREGLRTPGHLGERFMGIYYEYLKEKGGYRLGELQMALFGNTKVQACHKPSKQEIPIVLAADQAYVPVLFTCLKSVVEHTDACRKYHIYIFHTDIWEADMQVFQKELARPHVKIEFVDVGARVAGYRLEAKAHITTETYYRFLILDILKGCPKAVYLDADVVVCQDAAQLYDLPLGDCLLAAAVDPDFAGQYNGANPDTKDYCSKVLKLKDPFAYAQAGVLVLNVEALNQRTSVQELFAMADSGDYKYSDQDILNIVCEGRIHWIDMAWNMLIDSRRQRYGIIKSAPAYILDAYEQARKHPYIIHYAGDSKPWDNPWEDFAQEFWKMARQTPYYEELLWRAAKKREEKSVPAQKAAGIAVRAAKKVLPKGSAARRMAGRLYWMLK